MGLNNARQGVPVLNGENSIRLDPFEQCQIEILYINWQY